jgi:hypothetical protein
LLAYGEEVGVCSPWSNCVARHDREIVSVAC